MTNMSHLRQTVRGGAHLVSYGGGNFIQVKTMGEVPVTGMWDRTGGCIHGGTTPDPEWPGRAPPLVRIPSAARGPTDVLGILPKEGGVGVMPSRGLQRGEKRVDPTSGFASYTGMCGIQL